MVFDEDLTKHPAFQTQQSPVEETYDLKDLKYVMYVRKSTDEDSKQARSVGDQAKECEDFAKSNGYKVAKVILEKQSAKEANIKPQFTAMLDDITRGKYDGIIAWHPDRLARNMREAGEVIDLLDKGIIKALLFKSFTFENNPSGKLLLGIAFAMSKNYSDQLGINVMRGMKRSVQEGSALNLSKHGYYRDINKRLRPDGKYFDLICQAFRMRLEGNTTLKQIAEYLNKNGFKKSTKIGGGGYTDIKLTEKRVYEIFTDPIYCGLYTFGAIKEDLRKIYNFVPAVSVEEFLRINNAFAKKSRAHVKSNILRG